VLLAVTTGGPVAAPLGIGLGVFLVLSGLNEIVTRSWVRGAAPSLALRRAVGLPRSAWGAALAHAGVGVTVIGIAATAWSVEAIGSIKPGERIEAGGYAVRLDSVVPRTGPNFREDVARLTAFSGTREIGALETTKRIYTARNMPTTEAGIITLGVSQLYASFGDQQPDGAIGPAPVLQAASAADLARLHLMALGGALSLTDRRFRVGAPRARG
jgi:cytochrome c-type biogenesis protein CcmF